MSDLDYSEQWETKAGKHYLEKKLEIYKKFLKKGDRILDVGCADGIYTGKLREEYDVVGLDINLPMLKRARRRYPKIPFVNADAEKLPFRDGVFDASVSMSTIIWVSKPEKAVSELSRVTKKSGKVIADFSNRHCPFYFGLHKLTRFADRGKKFSKKEVINLFVKASMRNIECERILLMSRRFPNWLYYLLLPAEILIEKSPLKIFSGVIVCKGENK